MYDSNSDARFPGVEKGIESQKLLSNILDSFSAISNFNR